MLKVLLASFHKESLAGLASALAEHEDVQVSWAESGIQALDTISEATIDLVVTDEKLEDMTGLELASKLLSVNPMVNCVAVSPLSPEEFHETSEGLGLMAQLPVQPGKEQAQELLSKLKKLKNLAAGVSVGHT